MQNRTTNDRQQCPERSWCDVPAPHDGTHTGEHDGEADIPPITATGYREALVRHDDGLIAPEICCRLIEQVEPSGTLESLTINLSIANPHQAGGVDHLSAWLTLHEAELLSRHLGQLLRETGRKVLA